MLMVVSWPSVFCENCSAMTDVVIYCALVAVAGELLRRSVGGGLSGVSESHAFC